MIKQDKIGIKSETNILRLVYELHFTELRYRIKN